MDIQKLLDTISDASRNTRSGYHLTLGELTTLLREADPAVLVEFDDGASVGDETSYRGHYADLAFEAGGKPSTAADVLNACVRATTRTYEGYKGGDFTYDERTPLWRAEWGCTGPAIIATLAQDDRIILITRDVD